jgi:hypothetical protein
MARIRYYGPLPRTTRIDGHDVLGELGPEVANVVRWKDPPHEALANVRRSDDERGLCDPKAVGAFVKRYGVLHARLDNWSPSSSSNFDESCLSFSRSQSVLRDAWRNEAEALLDVNVQIESALDASTSMNAGSIELATENLWSFICVLFLRDFQLGKAKVCASPDCLHPYFVEQRKGQRYCSHLCAVRENVRRFRRAAAKVRRPKGPRKSGRRRR